MPRTLEELVDPEELDELAQHYGPFDRQHTVLPMSDGSLDFYRRAFRNRRGEILFVLCRQDGRILLHTKRSYPDGVYRLPGGGVDWGERASDALRREVHEETQFPVRDERFLGLLTYDFVGQAEPVRFVSYVFLVPNLNGEPQPLDQSEAITGFRWVSTTDLAGVADQLRGLEPEEGRREWGQFRAIGHDFVRKRDF